MAFMSILFKRFFNWTKSDYQKLRQLVQVAEKNAGTSGVVNYDDIAKHFPDKEYLDICYAIESPPTEFQAEDVRKPPNASPPNYQKIFEMIENLSGIYRVSDTKRSLRMGYVQQYRMSKSIRERVLEYVKKENWKVKWHSIRLAYHNYVHEVKLRLNSDQEADILSKYNRGIPIERIAQEYEVSVTQMKEVLVNLKKRSYSQEDLRSLKVLLRRQFQVIGHQFDALSRITGLEVSEVTQMLRSLPRAYIAARSLDSKGGKTRLFNRWNSASLKKLEELVSSYTSKNEKIDWEHVAKTVGFSEDSCKSKYQFRFKVFREGFWTEEENLAVMKEWKIHGDDIQSYTLPYSRHPHSITRKLKLLLENYLKGKCKVLGVTELDLDQEKIKKFLLARTRRKQDRKNMSSNRENS